MVVEEFSAIAYFYSSCMLFEQDSIDLTNSLIFIIYHEVYSADQQANQPAAVWYSQQTRPNRSYLLTEPIHTHSLRK